MDRALIEIRMTDLYDNLGIDLWDYTDEELFSIWIKITGIIKEIDESKVSSSIEALGLR